ncbi:MAG: hypothetical protein ACT4PM_14265 [Gemmatimonadales bacterium]
MSPAEPTDDEDDPPTESGPGLPFGAYNDEFTGALSAQFTSAHLKLDNPAEATSFLTQARAQAKRVIIILGGPRFSGTTCAFDRAIFAETLSRFAGFDFGVYADVIIGVNLIEEPHDPQGVCATTGGRFAPIPPADLDWMAEQSKTTLMGLAAVPHSVRTSWSYLAAASWQHLDFNIVFYTENRDGQTAAQFRPAQEQQARSLGLGVALGFQAVLGTAAHGPITAAMFREWGLELARSAESCALLFYQYDEGFLAQAGMSEAMQAVREEAAARTPPPCARP